jgi:flavin reductase (DIM6/NTAB) family NADH-FMN oxidoreductase RutF
VFTIGFSITGDTPKDTLVQLLETGECTINIISEWFVEAANYTSINAPPGVSEWEMSGLTKGETVVVKAPRVKESVFAIEAKLITHHEWAGKQSGKHTGTLAILEGVIFHVREDALEGGVLDPAKVKVVSRLGGITFGRTVSGFELTRPKYEEEKEKEEFQEAVWGKPTDSEL